MPENDPKLWTADGLADAVEEACGEMGIAINYGEVCLGRVYQSSRSLSPMMNMKDLRENPGVVELWATITVDPDDVISYLKADAALHLKPSQRFEVRRKIPDNFGRTHGMAWYRNDAMEKRESWGRVPSKPEYVNGYYLVGEFVTPSEE